MSAFLRRAAAAVLGLVLCLAWASPAAAVQTVWTGTVGGATAYPSDFWESGESVGYGDYYSPYYWPEGMNVVHTLAFNYSGAVRDVRIGFQIRGRAGTAFVEPARIVDDAHGACPGTGVFEYSSDGVTWSSEFFVGATYALYETDTNAFIDMSPRDGTPCLVGVLATADRPSQSQTTTNADLYRQMDVTDETLHNSSLYSYAVTSESDFTQQDFGLTTDRPGTVAHGDVVGYELTMRSLRHTSTLTARSHEIDVSGLLDDADVGDAITTSTGSAALTDDKIVWTSDGAAIAAGAVVTLAFTATFHGGGDGDARAVVNGPTGSASWPFNLHNGPRSNCQTVPGAQGYVWVDGHLMPGAELAALTAEEFATVAGECAVVQRVGVTVAADAGGPYELDEGAASLTLDASRTVAPPDALYAWDLDGDGEYDDATGPQPTVTARQLAEFGLGDGPAVGSARLLVTAGRTLAETAETTVTVRNLPPSVTVEAPPEAVAGTPVTVALRATDAWPPDVAAPRHTIDWGDGTVEVVTTDTPSHTYSGPGAYVVTVTVRDKDGADSAPATATIAVSPVAAPSPPTDTAETAGMLPVTGVGGDLPATAAAGLVLLVVGVALVVRGRRRRRGPVSPRAGVS
ncbi:PKD domain-containing protein [Actinosynnema sp. NPDC023794]